MRVICPLCGASNRVVDGYTPGAVLACTCGAFLEFVAPDEQPKVVEQMRMGNREVETDPTLPPKLES